MDTNDSYLISMLHSQRLVKIHLLYSKEYSSSNRPDQPINVKPGFLVLIFKERTSPTGRSCISIPTPIRIYDRTNVKLMGYENLPKYSENLSIDFDLPLIGENFHVRSFLNRIKMRLYVDFEVVINESRSLPNGSGIVRHELRATAGWDTFLLSVYTGYQNHDSPIKY